MELTLGKKEYNQLNKNIENDNIYNRNNSWSLFRLEA
jgi:hypothetical protein